MIPMACPNCGRRGNVPPDKLNARLHCKKCDAVFHMDMSGHIVLGEPGADKKKPDSIFGLKTSAAPKPKVRAKDEPMDLLGNLKDAWTGIPLAGRIVLGAAALAAIVMFSGIRLPRLGGPPLPPDFNGRALYLADAFIEDSSSRIRKLAAPGTEADAAAWLSKVRPGFQHSGPRRQGNIVTVLPPMILEQDRTKGRGRVLMYLLPPIPKPDAANPDKGYFAPGYRADGTFALPTLWKPDAAGRWQFDGTASLANASKPTTAKEDPEPVFSRGRAITSGSGSHRDRN